MTKPVTMITKNESHQLIESPIKVMARMAQLRNRRLGMTPMVAAGCQVWLSAPLQEASVGRANTTSAGTRSDAASEPHRIVPIIAVLVDETPGSPSSLSRDF